MWTHWHPYPMARLVLPFITGLFLADQLEVYCPWVVLLAVLFFLSICSRFTLSKTGQHIYGWLWIIWVILAGTSWLGLHVPHLPEEMSHPPGQHLDWQGTISKVSENDRWQRLTVEVRENLTDPLRHPDPRSKILVYVPSELARPRLPGEEVAFSGIPTPIPPPSDPHGFDWKRYQFVRGVQEQVFLKDSLKSLQAQTNWMLRFSRARSDLETRLDQLIPDTLARQLLQAILLGARDDLGEDLNKAYQSSGAVHILAVSGLHVGLVAGCCLFLLGWLLPGRRRQFIVAAPTVALVWTYILLTGAADSALRAGVLFTFLILGRSISRYADALNLLAAAVFLLLLIDPWMIFHVGFQLSVLAVAGILVLHPLIFRSWVPPDRVTRFFWNLTAVTLAAQIATVCLSLYYFHQLPVYFLLAGWFVVPMSGLVLASGWLILLLHMVSPAAAMALAWIPTMLATGMNALVFAIASLPSALSVGWSPAVWWTVLVPLAIGLVIHALARSQPTALLLGLGALALGLALDVLAGMEQHRQVEWGVVRRQGSGMEILLREEGATALLDLSGERRDIEHVRLIGYGPTWLIPGSLDFTFGTFKKAGSSIQYRARQLSWGDQPSGQIYLASCGYPVPLDPIAHPAKVLLPRDMKPWHRAAWRTMDSSSIIDLRHHGYWVEDLAPEAGSSSLGQQPGEME